VARRSAHAAGATFGARKSATADALRVRVDCWCDACQEDPGTLNSGTIRETVSWVKAAADADAGANRNFLSWLLDRETTPRLRWWQSMVSDSQGLLEACKALTEAGLATTKDFPQDLPLAEWHASMQLRHATLSAHLGLLLQRVASREFGVEDAGKAGAALAGLYRLG